VLFIVEVMYQILIYKLLVQTINYCRFAFPIRYFETLKARWKPTMFHWEPEGRLYTPFILHIYSAHLVFNRILWTVLTLFWLSTDDLHETWEALVHSAALLWQKEANDESDISCKRAKCDWHLHWHQCNIMTPWLKSLTEGLVLLFKTACNYNMLSTIWIQ